MIILCILYFIVFYCTYLILLYIIILISEPVIIVADIKLHRIKPHSNYLLCLQSSHTMTSETSAKPRLRDISLGLGKNKQLPGIYGVPENRNASERSLKRCPERRI